MPLPGIVQLLDESENGAVVSSACSTSSDQVVSTQSILPSMPLSAFFVHAPGPGRSPSWAEMRTGRTSSVVPLKVITSASFGVAARS